MVSSPLTSSQVADLYGIAQASLRLYEAEGIVSPLRVGEERYYSRRDRVRIEIILKGQRLGFPLKEIKSLILAHLPEPRAVRGPVQIRQRIDQLEVEKREIQAAIDRLSGKIDEEPA